MIRLRHGLFILLLSGCIESNQSLTEESVKSVSAMHAFDSLQALKSPKLDSSYVNGAPCKELQDFVVEIEQVNWVSDTGRLREVGIYPELRREKIQYFNNRPFYAIGFEDSRINKASSVDFLRKRMKPLNIELFTGVQNIYGYFYRDKEAEDWVTDGVIEQWQFETKSQAEKALTEIQKFGSMIYFNTNPYFCRVRNNLIIFQSRAMSFSYAQKPIFQKFAEEHTDRIISDK